MKEIINFSKLLKSFKNAFQGLKSALNEQVFRIFCLASILVIILMIVLGLSLLEKIILILIVIFLLTLELLNSQIEKFFDITHPDYHPKIRKIKDIFAGTVLLASFGALIIGLLIFLPYFLKLFE